jgi:hypothetical protein
MASAGSDGQSYKHLHQVLQSIFVNWLVCQALFLQVMWQMTVPWGPSVAIARHLALSNRAP